jgi:hypothetical protein
VLCFFDAGWHNDDGMGVADVRFATYFDVLEADSGALRFIPESRRREQQPRTVLIPATVDGNRRA